MKETKKAVVTKQGMPLNSLDSGEVLRLGSRNTSVATVQRRLRGLGLYRGPVDGFYGAKTLEAVKKFQQGMKLVADGVVGPMTWIRLNGAAWVRQVNNGQVGNAVTHQYETTAALAGIFEIRLSAGPVVKTGSNIEYSLSQIQATFIAAGGRYHPSWSVQNHPFVASGGLPRVLTGPRDVWTWKIHAQQAGVHRIEAKIELNDTLFEKLSFEQTVTDDGRSLLHQEIIKIASVLAADAHVREWTTAEIGRAHV